MAPKPARVKYYTPHAIAAYGSEYLRNGGNGVAALRAIFPEETFKPERAGQISGAIKRKPEIVKLIEGRERQQALALSDALERYGATADRTGEELARMAFAQVRDVIDWGTEADPKDPKKRRQYLRVRDASEISEDAHRAIVKVTQRPDGSVTAELGDKLTALRDLARLKGWIADKPADNNQAISLIIQR